MSLSIDPQKTALLLLDFQNVLFQSRNIPREVATTTATLVDGAREKGVTIAHCRVAFEDSEKQNLPETNFSFGRLKDNPIFFESLSITAPGSQYLEELSPKPGDIDLRKIRHGPFMCGPSAGFHDEFQKCGITTLVIGGVVTSGAVLSAVRQAADLDYQLIVLEDCCWDPEEEVHRVLMTNVFSRQGYVMKSGEFDKLLK
jgi:nicotinamidase-related amidase